MAHETPDIGAGRRSTITGSGGTTEPARTQGDVMEDANGNAVEGLGVHGVAGTASGIIGSIGVLGTSPTGTDTFGGSLQGWTGLMVNGSQTTIRMVKSTFGPPASTGNNYVQGDMTVDNNGDLWYCISGGPPSVWRQLAATNSAGTYHSLTPGRVYDSRCPLPFPGPITSGSTRLLSVADRRSLDTGAVVEADFVPANATAVFANVTVIAGGPGSTDFLLDITGYWL